MKHKKTFRNILSTILLLLLVLIILLSPKQSFLYARKGLLLWFNQIIPTLFPFMVLSGILIKSRLISDKRACLYCIFTGFLCGFPMGAYNAALMYEEKKLDKKKAELLMAFTNNFGPAYIMSFLLPLVQYPSRVLLLTGLYGIPFLYGSMMLFLHWTKTKNRKKNVVKENVAISTSIHIIEDAITSSIESVTRLGGYIVLFQTFYTVPELFQQYVSQDFIDKCCSILEISGGIQLLAEHEPEWILCLLPFGGLSCVMQVASIISRTDLSMKKYIGNKACLTMLSVIFYAFLF